MKYVRVKYTVNHYKKLNKVEYYAFYETATDEQIRTFIKNKQDEFECKVVEFLMKALDYTEEWAIWQSAVAVDWDNIEIQIIKL